MSFTVCKILRSTMRSDIPTSMDSLTRHRYAISYSISLPTAPVTAVTLRHSNLEPVNTDYITFVRELAGQPWKT